MRSNIFVETQLRKLAVCDTPIAQYIKQWYAVSHFHVKLLNITTAAVVLVAVRRAYDIFQNMVDALCLRRRGFHRTLVVALKKRLTSHAVTLSATKDSADILPYEQQQFLPRVQKRSSQLPGDGGGEPPTAIRSICIRKIVFLWGHLFVLAPSCPKRQMGWA